MPRFPLPVLFLAALAVAPAPALAWGRQGHAEVAALAEACLEPRPLAQVRDLLQDDRDAQGQPSGRGTLAEVASWPDELRDAAPAGAYKGWHTRANPVCAARLGPCPGGHCVDELIEHYGAILQDPGQPPRLRNEALKWVVHLVGDLHQPLHSGVALDHGQAPVRSLRGKAVKPGTTLHQVWDTQLARIALDGWHGQVRAGDPSAAGTPRDWMLESRDVALENVYQPIPGFRCTSRLPEPLDLDQAYVDQAVPAIRRQIERAGARLAGLLNRWLR